MNEFEKISAEIIDDVCEVAESQHPEIKSETQQTIEEGIENPALITGEIYYRLESKIARKIRDVKTYKIPTCCSKEMIDLGFVDVMNGNVNSIHRFICDDCGIIEDTTNYCLDDEELIDLLKNYPDKPELLEFKKKIMLSSGIEE